MIGKFRISLVTVHSPRIWPVLFVMKCDKFFLLRKFLSFFFVSLSIRTTDEKCPLNLLVFKGTSVHGPSDLYIS